MEPFLGEIRLFGFYYPPRGWALCDGQMLPIQQNSALFALLGTQFGGNGTQNFGVPDLRGRAPIGQGQGTDLSPRTMGKTTGTESITISTTQMPSHTHVATVTNALNANAKEGTLTAPVSGSSLAAMVDTSVNKILSYNSEAPTISTAGASPTITNAPTGNGLPISVMQPTLVINYCIALEGIFPSRN
ncbi:phage tail protein [Pedobacter gandavensis]|uniref:phage tail protein n=1 Tax=Pedobacter gandavensis TaxID=2679963 RepID=UPI00292FF467|nr:tail fiber protein [Pedobacter gandavensis]